MSTYYEFDAYGWYVGSHPIPEPRTTEFVPPDLTVDQTAGSPRSMYTGYGWKVMEYQPPVKVSFRHVDGRMTRLAFRNRFSMAEKVAIEFASLDNPTAPTEQRLQSAGLRVVLADQRDAQFIDLSSEATIAGVTQLEQLGLLSEGRAQQILQDAISEDELFEQP